MHLAPCIYRITLFAIIILFSLNPLSLNSQDLCSISAPPITVESGEFLTYATPTVMVRNIIVEAGGTLTVTSTLRMSTGKQIVVKRGGRMIVNGGTITNLCENELWKGIFVHGNSFAPQFLSLTDPIPSTRSGQVILRSALIEWAEIGVITSTSIGKGTTELLSRGGLIDAENTIFRNNIIGVVFTAYGFDNASRFKLCTFEETFSSNLENTVGVSINRGFGVEFEQNNFLYLDNAGIASHRAGYDVFENNQFRSILVGIHATGDMTFGPTIRIGIDFPGVSFEPNRFIDNNIHILLEGGGNSFAKAVYDNTFEGGVIGVYGGEDTRLFVSRNVFNNVHKGVVISNSYESRVTVFCNTFEGGCTNIDVAGRCDEFTFNGNDSYGCVVNFILREKEVPSGAIVFGSIPDQGNTTLFQPANNCFNEPHNPSIPNDEPNPDFSVDIITLGSTDFFAYFYANNANYCDVSPDYSIFGTNNYGSLGVPDPLGQCYETPLLTVEVSDPALDDIRSSLSQAEIDLAADPDNPEKQYNYNSLFREKENILALLMEQKINNRLFQEAENLLFEESTDRQEKWGFNIKLLAKDYDGASMILNNMDINSSSSVFNFVKTQEIVLASEMDAPNFTLDDDQKSILETIVNGGEEYSSFAKGLLQFYDETYVAAMPEEDSSLPCQLTAQPTSEPISSSTDLKVAFDIYPNPVSSRLLINYPELEEGQYDVKVFDALGQLIRPLTLSKQTSQTTIDFSGHHSGIYFLQILQDNKPVYQEKIIYQGQ